jgi:PAS domain S-box-containing protein
MGPRFRCLLVADRREERERASRFLHEELPEVECVEVTDAQALAAAFGNGGFDLTITDHPLAWGDGADVVREAKRRSPSKPVIMLVESEGEESVVQAMAVGLDDYVVKTDGRIPRLGRAVRTALEQVRLHAALREIQGRYRSLYENVPVAVLRATVEGRIVEVNHACLELFGYTDRASLFEVSAERLYVDLNDREVVRGTAAREGIIRGHPTRMLRRDGTEFWALIDARVVRDGRGEIAGFLGFIQDITRPRGAQEELREKEQILQQIIENAEEILCVRCVDTGRMISVNPAWDDVTGRSRQSVLADPFSILDIVHPEDREKLRPFLEDPSSARFDVEFRIIHPDGTPRWLRMRSYPVLDTAGRVSRTVSITQDVTPLHEPKEVLSDLAEFNRRSP